MATFMKIWSTIFSTMVMMMLQWYTSPAVRILNREVDGCMCSDFTWFREDAPQGVSQGQQRKGVFLGGCRSRDEDGKEFCYVHQPNTCSDAKPSLKFDGMEVSANACDCKFNRFGQCAKEGDEGILGNLIYHTIKYIGQNSVIFYYIS